MTDYTELVKALRWCADEAICCDDFNGEKCPYYDVRHDSCNTDAVLHDAADAIEALVKRVKRAEKKSSYIRAKQTYTRTCIGAHMKRS